MDRVSTFKALAHPARLQLLSLLTGACLSAAEAARETGMSQANASYHLRLLERAGLLKVVEEVTVRGGRARRYRHVSSSASDPAAPRELAATHQMRVAEEEFVSLLASELRRRYAQRTDGPKTNVDADLWVAPEVWQQVVDGVGDAAALLHAAAVPPRSPEAVRVSMTAALFTTAPS